MFQADSDIYYADLLALTEESLEGLPTILKNMKRLKMISYDDPVLKDESIITVISDYDNSKAKPLLVTYEQINEKVIDRGAGTHEKVRGW